VHKLGWITRQPLWLKLTAAVACLTGAGLAVLAVTVAVVVHGYLMGKVDQQVRGDAQHLMSGPRGIRHNLLTSTYPDSLLSVALPGTARGLEVLDAAGQRLGPGGRAGAGLDLHLSPAWIRAHLRRLVTMPGQHGGPGWRVMLEPIRYQARHLLFVYGPGDYSLSVGKRAAGFPGTLAVGVELGGVNRSTGRLVTIEAAAGAALIVLLAGLTALAARASMRRLAGIGTFPAQAANGDLPPPFPGHNEKSEAGRVTRTLNDLLGQAQQSLAERAAAEQAIRDRAGELGQRLASTVQELRGPLSIITGFAGYYRERSPIGPADFDRMMKRIGDETARMTRTVDELAPGGQPGAQPDGQPGVPLGAQPGGQPDGQPGGQPDGQPGGQPGFAQANE
jgi:two-component system, OmpR family, sensor kinase